MKTLYWTYGSIVTSFALLLGIWGIVGEPRYQEFFKESPQPMSQQAESFSPPAAPLTGREALYRAVASPDDIARYRAIARLTREKQWDEANAIISRLKNDTLLPYFLAARYTDTSYTPGAVELMLWLANHHYLPQANAVATRLKQLYPSDYKEAVKPSTYRTLKGGSDASRDHVSLRPEDMELWKSGFGSLGSGYYSAAYKAGVSIVRQSAGKSQHGNWLAGLAAWRLNDFTAASRHFSAMASSEHVAAPYRAGAAFWAHRAFSKLGNAEKAQEYLNRAAEDPDSFYGLIAMAELGRPSWRPYARPATERSNWQEFARRQPVAQIILLNAIGENAAAEQLLRHSYFTLRQDERAHLTEVAHMLGMASVVLPMARHTNSEEAVLQAAHYPIPAWRDGLAHNSDHALVMAIAKQESGFNPRVSSPQGAQGLMQILPSTAAYVRRQKGALEVKTASLSDTAGLQSLPRTWNLLDPEYNLAIGQAYIRYLMEKPYVRGNLVYMLVSYNAGAVPLLRWKETLETDDPLLFIESIPYAETRHYVSNVLRNYWIYKGILEERPVPASLSRLTDDRWPVLG